MADTPSTNLKARLIQTGTYRDTWGQVMSLDAIQLLDDAIAGREDITLSALTYSMPALVMGTDGASRAACLRFVGTPAGLVTITVPGSLLSKWYLIHNQCGQAITIGYATGATVTIANGELRLIYCHSLAGGNVISLSSNADASTLGGTAAALYARRDQANNFLGTDRHPWVDITEAPITAMNAEDGSHQRLTLTGNRSFTIPTNPADGMQITLRVIQDGFGGRTLSWHGIFEFANGAPPVLTTVPGAADLFVMWYDLDVNTWFVGYLGSIFAGVTSAYDFVIDSCGQDVSLLELVGTIGVAITLNLTIARGAILQAGSTGSWALDLYNALPVGSTINFVNLGVAKGCGGDGGAGGAMSDQGAGLGGNNYVNAYDGKPGGIAIRGPGPGITFNVTNANGKIWGGGGGGGGGGVSLAGTGNANGGGGGAGTGGAKGGPGGRAGGGAYAVNGVDSPSGVLSALGAGGAGTASGGTAGNGGAGGDWGTAGFAGTDTAPGAAGAAGKAIDLMGGAITWVSGSGAPNTKGVVS